jgi:predicted kinase
MVRAFILIGIPGSGKSTLGRQIVKASEGRARVASLDNCRRAVNGDSSDQGNFPEVLERFHARLESLMSDNFDIVVDNTNTRVKDRKRLCSILKDNGYEVHAIWLDCSVEQAMENQTKRERFVPQEDVERMFNRLQQIEPTLDEGYDYLYKVPVAPLN